MRIAHSNIGNKICSRCNKEKDMESSFYKKRQKNTSHIYSGHCIECEKTGYNKEEYKQRKIALKKARLLIDPEFLKKTRAWNRKFRRQSSPEYWYGLRIKHQYSLSMEDVTKMKKEQNSSCAICKKPENEIVRKKLCIDHDHKTDFVRGLLCSNCNTAIGLFEENAESIQNAVIYLKLAKANYEHSISN